MSYKVEVTSAALDWQVQAIKWFPEISNKIFYPAMWRAARAVEAEIKPNVPRATGRAQDAFKSQVSGNGLNIQAQIGWFGKNMPYYINVLEYGARPHDQGYIPFLGLRINHHPGLPALKFMEQGFQASQGIVNEEMQKAGDELVLALAVK
jgi:hypothetical protein